ncbi:MAG TPA: hypothetical protein VGR57_12155 [Ktedonobacterales bacterium]|nr:hypothetical protein [Ktedonobacterales bacterium]
MPAKEPTKAPEPELALGLPPTFDPASARPAPLGDAYAAPERPGEVRCTCGEVLVHTERDGTRLLHVHERQLLRPHPLTDDQLPLAWPCPRCGEVTTLDV